MGWAILDPQLSRLRDQVGTKNYRTPSRSAAAQLPWLGDTPQVPPTARAETRWRGHRWQSSRHSREQIAGATSRLPGTEHKRLCLTLQSEAAKMNSPN